MEEGGVGCEENQSGAVEEYLARDCEMMGAHLLQANNRVRNGPCNEEEWLSRCVYGCKGCCCTE